MKFSMRFEGGEELAKRLNALPQALTRKIVLNALRAGAQPIRDRAQQLAPRSSGGSWGHLQDHIVIGTANRIGSTAGGRWTARDETEHAVAVGPRQDFFYGLFQEYGTAFHAAQPFMRPAFDSGAPAALGIIGQELWNALRKAIPTSFPAGLSSNREVFARAA